MGRREERPRGWTKCLKGQGPLHSGFNVCATTTVGSGCGCFSASALFLEWGSCGGRGSEQWWSKCTVFTCVTESSPAAPQLRLPSPPPISTRLGSPPSLCHVSGALEKKTRLINRPLGSPWTSLGGAAEQHSQIRGRGRVCLSFHCISCQNLEMGRFCVQIHSSSFCNTITRLGCYMWSLHCLVIICWGWEWASQTGDILPFTKTLTTLEHCSWPASSIRFTFQTLKALHLPPTHNRSPSWPGVYVLFSSA